MNKNYLQSLSNKEIIYLSLFELLYLIFKKFIIIYIIQFSYIFHS